MKSSNQTEVTILLRCVDLPGRTIDGRQDIKVGAQKGDEVIDLVSGGAKEASFSFPLRVEKSKTGKPNFLGPFAHGTPTDRFLYLSWNEQKGAHRVRFGRVKVKLNHITWASVEKALNSGKPIEATLKLTDSKGGPLCASVKPEFIKWKL